MPNTFFELTPENYDEVFNKWRIFTDDEIRAASAAKSRIYVSVADIEQIQNAFEITLQTAENLVGGLNKDDERRIMQMGYALQEIKEKLIKRIALEALRDSKDPEES
jgi:hypothetical protein